MATSALLYDEGRSLPNIQGVAVVQHDGGAKLFVGGRASPSPGTNDAMIAQQ